MGQGWLEARLTQYLFAELRSLEETKMDSFISFAGKRVVVTGAYSGIGACLVDLLKLSLIHI